MRVNDEADPLRAQDFPDGFLFFHYALEVYPAPGVPREERVKLTAKLLQALWSRGFAAIAACDYEDELPSGGGYKSRPYPWVRTETSVSSSRAV